MMKKSLYILILGGCYLLLASSCKKSSLLTYNAADNIYFNFIASTEPTVIGDSTIVTFAFAGSTVQDTIVKVPVSVTGVAKDHDRSFDVTIDANSTAVASTDYELPSSYIVHAGQITDTIAIRFKRTPALQNSSVFLALRLKANDEFKTQLQLRSRQQNDVTEIEPGDTIQMQTFKIIVSDKLEAGPYWNDYSFYFGDFSEKKVRLMNQIAGLPLDFWSVGISSDAQKRNEAIGYGGFMFRYLTDQAFAGNTIFESDGVTAMTMGYYFN